MRLSERKAILLLIATLLIIASMFVNSKTAYAEIRTDFGLQGIELQNSDTPDGIGMNINGVSWDSSSKTLTFNNVNYNYDGSWTGVYSSLFYFNFEGNITISLKGKNNFNLGTGNSLFKCGQSSNLTIIGPGQLTVSNGASIIHSVSGPSANNITVKDKASIKFYEPSGTSYATIECSGVFKAEKGTKLYIELAQHQWAVKANKMTNDPSSLQKILGNLASGAKFKASDGSLYKVNQHSSFVHKATLVKAGSKKNVNVNNVNYGGTNYYVNEIASGAFKNSKVAKLTIGANVEKIGKNAFYNTKKLTSFGFANSSGNFTSTPTNLIVDYGNKVKFKSGVNNKAFSKMGKSSGKKLTVHSGVTLSTYTKYNSYLKKAMVSKGASSKITVKK